MVDVDSFDPKLNQPTDAVLGRWEWYAEKDVRRARIVEFVPAHFVPEMVSPIDHIVESAEDPLGMIVGKSWFTIMDALLRKGWRLTLHGQIDE